MNPWPLKSDPPLPNAALLYTGQLPLNLLYLARFFLFMINSPQNKDFIETF